MSSLNIISGRGGGRDSMSGGRGGDRGGRGGGRGKLIEGHYYILIYM